MMEEQLEKKEGEGLETMGVVRKLCKLILGF